MDVKALYPSITAKQAGEAVRRAMRTTRLHIDNVNYHMALRYIAKAAESDAQVTAWGFGKWCPRRTKKPGHRPGMTGDASVDEKWTEGTIPTDMASKREILGKVLEIAVVKIFKSNIYRFGGNTYLQTDGAPIGMDLSGEIGRLVMAIWDGDFMELCDANNIVIDLNERYVDDDDMVMPAIPTGFRLDEGKLVFREEWRQEDVAMNAKDDARTTKLMVELANQIHPNIVMTGDYPSNYAHNKVPMLDLEIFMEKKEAEVDYNGEKHTLEIEQVCFTFFKKTMASKLILRADTALPERMKYQNASNELIRRLLNTSRAMAKYDDEVVRVTNEFMVTLKISGYTEGFRLQIALSAHRGVRKMEERDEEGIRNLYRLQTEGASWRHKMKTGANSNWFKKKKEEEKTTEKAHGGGGKPKYKTNQVKNEGRRGKKDEREVDGVIFVPFTNKGRLKEALQQQDDDMTRVMRTPRVRYIENPGTAIKDILVEKDPWFRLAGGCSRPNCPVCYWNHGKGIRCTKEGVCYRIQCHLCE